MNLPLTERPILQMPAFREWPPIETAGDTFHPWIPGDLVAAQAARIGAHLADRLRGEEVRFIRVQGGGAFFGSLVLRSVLEQVAAGEGPENVVTSDVQITNCRDKIPLLESLRRPLEHTEHVIAVDGIADPPHRLRVLGDNIERQGPASIAMVAMLDRPETREKGAVTPDFAAFRVGNPEVAAIGCGMDFDGFGRDLPDIYGLEVDGQLPPRSIALSPHHFDKPRPRLPGEPALPSCGPCIDAVALSGLPAHVIEALLKKRQAVNSSHT